ncbi:DUF2752 domain-containing protein [Streptomyces sp. NPDC051561]|uniref:DUF2752 domain-containing protein n=1 Tax=Streptomyces sp. NPDC051561 TaxID=3365658 RepID=UPI0037B3AAA6
MTGAPLRSPARLLPVLVTAAGLAGLVYVFVHSPYDPGQLFLRCPWKLVTGLDCPACGGTRMTYSLLHGDLPGAWRANPVLLLAAPWVLWLYGRWSAATVRGRRYRVALGTKGVTALVSVAALWTLVRNL